MWNLHCRFCSLLHERHLLSNHINAHAQTLRLKEIIIYTATMGRPQSLRWKYFTKVSAPKNMKKKRAKCKFCCRTVSASSQNMDTYSRNWSEMSRTIGALLKPLQSSQDSVSPALPSDSSAVEKRNCDKSQRNERRNASHVGSISSFIMHHVTTARRDELNVLFAKAIHETATSMSFF